MSAVDLSDRVVLPLELDPKSQSIFDSRYVSKCKRRTFPAPGRCPNCKEQLVPHGGDPNHPQRYCGKQCRKVILELDYAARAERRGETPTGYCVACGADLKMEFRCRNPRGGAIRRWRRAAGGQLRWRTEAWEWLAGKLDVPPDHPRLPEAALALADAGRLALFVRDGRIIGIAKAKRNGRP